MRKLLVLAAIGTQLAVLLFMAGGRELILANGRTVVVRTAPIDPRDPFRGDFVRLRYAFNSSAGNTLRGQLGQTEHRRHDPVYAVLKQTPGGLFGLDYLTDLQPEKSPFLLGKITSASGRAGPFLPISHARFSFGIEQLFVEQGTGIAIEKRRGRRNTVQVPMEVELAVSDAGTALIKGFRWSPVGIQSELVTLERPGSQRDSDAPQRPATPRQSSPRIRISLSNVSNKPLSILDLRSGCALHLTIVTAAPTDARLNLQNDPCKASDPANHDVVQLAPGESHGVAIDLAAPRWHVSRQEKDNRHTSGEIGVVAPQVTYRFVYRADPAAAPSASDLWLGELPSRALRATGFVD